MSISAEVPDTRLDVGARIKRIVDAEALRGLGHELHQASRAPSRDGARVVGGLGVDHRGDEIGRYVVPSGNLLDVRVEVAFAVGL